MLKAAIRRLELLRAFAALAAMACWSTGVQASLPMGAAVMAKVLTDQCAATAGDAAGLSKAAQLVGGTSALEAVRARQGGTAATHPLLASAADTPFQPAAAPMPDAGSPCSDAIPGMAPIADFSAPEEGRNTILGSRTVRIMHTGFDAQWARANGDTPDLGAALPALFASDADRNARILAVNAWVNREIAHAEDTDLFGRGDYWAGAGTTLELRQGDCEDFALLKLEMLAASGIDREDMVLTLARDTIRSRDHALLMVRDADGAWQMLDNVGTAPLDASLAYGYRPVISLGASQSWLHGY